MLTIVFVLGVVACLRCFLGLWMNQPLYESIDKSCRRTKKQNLTLLDLNELQVELRALRDQARRRLRKRNKIHAKLHRAELRVERKLGERLRQRSSES